MPEKPTLLIVDDEANVLFTLKLVLEEDGYDITTASTCAEALKLIHNAHRFDAILTDLRMEREDIGLELAEAAAKLRPRPVIMIFTGYGSVGGRFHRSRMGLFLALLFGALLLAVRVIIASIVVLLLVLLGRLP